MGVHGCRATAYWRGGRGPGALLCVPVATPRPAPPSPAPLPQQGREAGVPRSASVLAATFASSWSTLVLAALLIMCIHLYLSIQCKRFEKNKAAAQLVNETLLALAFA